MRIVSLYLASLAVLAAPLTWAAGNPAEGHAIFEDMCSDCHTVSPGKNKRGPSLAGLIGRPAGSVANYHYSDAMANAKIVWTPERLGQYLAAPKTDVPGTKMRLLGKPSPQDVSNLIAWLQTTK